MCIGLMVYYAFPKNFCGRIIYLFDRPWEVLIHLQMNQYFLEALVPKGFLIVLKILQYVKVYMYLHILVCKLKYI